MFSKTLAGAVAAALVGLGAAATAAEAQVPITVTSSANAGPGTLRAAINQANSNFNRSFIEFNLPAIAGTVITPANDLPPITSDAKMTAAVPNFDGVRVWAGNFNVIGGAEDSARNVISGNTDDGVEIETGQANRVEGNRIGTSGGGVTSLPNGYGVFVETSFSVIVDNLVSGNTDAGATLVGVGFGPPPIGNLVDGNEVAGNGMGGGRGLARQRDHRQRDLRQPERWRADRGGRPGQLERQLADRQHDRRQRPQRRPNQRRRREPRRPA